ncbi:MAG: vanadium-dependent haloperoxidase, partial [Gaiellaceae bacterium]
MAGRRIVWFVAAAACALVGALGVIGASAAPPHEADASSVTQWNLIAANTLAGLPQPAGGAAPASQINMGMVQGAVYDAVNAITPKHHRPYLLKRRFGNTASDEAAIGTAAYLVLTNIVETVPQSIAFPTRGSVLASLASQYDASKNAIPDSPFKNQGIAAGTAAAQAVIAARQGDGRFGPSQWVPNSAPGHWDPVAPNGATVPDPTPWVGGVEPFLMQSSSQFRSPGPPALTSAAWAADFNEVKALGGDGVVTPSTRTGTQTYIAKWWQSNPMASWNDVARQLIARNDLDVSDAARLLAMENLAAADAAINTWNNKYHFDFWRPFQAIRKAATDNNPATSPDLTWTPLISAPYPEYTSGHLGLDSSHIGVLRMFFDDAPAGGYQITSSFVNPGGPATRTFGSFSQALDEIVEARIWAGLHFRTADVQAVLLGTNVANYAAANYFEPVG